MNSARSARSWSSSQSAYTSREASSAGSATMALRKPASRVIERPSLSFQTCRRPPHRLLLRGLLQRLDRPGFRLGQFAQPYQVIEPLHFRPFVRLLDRVQDREVLPEIHHVGADEGEFGLLLLI